VSLTTRALSVDGLAPEQQGKALYRRGLAYAEINEDDKAEADYKAALKVVPGDAGITAALKNLEARTAARKQAQRKAYAKMFS
jgi:peptidyl-prolyl isomerase D